MSDKSWVLAGGSVWMMRAFYSYAAPEPDGLKIGRNQASGSWLQFGHVRVIFDVRRLRTADDPDSKLRISTETTKQALTGVGRARWNGKFVA